MQTHTLDGKPRKKRYKPYKNSRFASQEDMLLFILIYLRDATSCWVSSLVQPVANKWIHLLLPILNKTLAKLEALPSRETDPAPMRDACEVSTQSQEVEHFFS